MSSAEDRKREERAFDALIVSQLRRERHILDLNDLPALTDEETAAMNTVPDDLIDTLWEEECKAPDGEPCADEDEECALAGAGDDSYSFFNRATDIGEEDNETLNESRDEALKELKKRMQKPKDEIDA